MAIEIVGVRLTALQLAVGGAALALFLFAGVAKNREGLKEVLPYFGKLIPYLVAAGVIYLGATSFGNLFQLSDRQIAIGVAVLLVGIYVVATSQEELSIPFWLTFVPLVLVLLQVLVPEWVAAAFAPVFRVVGVSPRAIDAVRLAILALAGVVVYWAVQFRAGSGSDNADTITKKILGSGRTGRKGELTKLVSEYVTMGRLVVGFVFATATIALAEGGQLSAEAASFLADAPVVASNLVAAVMGFFALGGTLPPWLAWIPGLSALVDLLGGIAPVTFLVVALVILGVAFGAREQLQDFRSTLARERAKKREFKQQAEADDD